MRFLILVTALGFLATSCSNGSSGGSDSTPSASGGPATPAAPANPATPADPTWTNFSYTGTLSGGSSGGTVVYSIDTSAKTLNLSIPIDDPGLNITLNPIAISGLPGATVAVQQVKGIPTVEVFVPLSAIVGKLPSVNLPSGTPATTLPTGLAIPDLAAGALVFPIALGHNTTRTYLYVAPMSAGIFYNTSFNPTISLSYTIDNSSGNPAGAFYAIPYTTGKTDGGFFMSAVVPNQYTQLILNNL